MVTPEKLLHEVQTYVLKYLTNNLSPKLTFHNVNHTLDVVHAAREIASHFNLSDEQLNVVEIAAWFHDCGYARIYTGHENLSKTLAGDFLKERGYPQNLISLVLECIEATRYPQKPQSMEARILCDADLYHFTKPDYHRYENALRLELQIYFENKYSDTQWASINCSMLEHHEYFTTYGKNVLQKFKAINMERMRCKAIEEETKK